MNSTIELTSIAQRSRLRSAQYYLRAIEDRDDDTVIHGHALHFINDLEMSESTLVDIDDIIALREKLMGREDVIDEEADEWVPDEPDDDDEY